MSEMTGLMAFAATLFAVAAAAAVPGVPTEPLVLCDFDQVTVEWRSKFRRHQVVEVKRDGHTTHVLRLPFDLSAPPHYDWFRAMIKGGVDVRPYRYLSFRIRGDGSGTRMLAMLMQATEVSEKHPNGEIVAVASQRPVDLSFKGWRHLSLALAAFEDLEQIASHIDMVNFSLVRRPGEEGKAGEVMIDDVALSVEPLGEVVAEYVAYPPADIAVHSEEEFFSLLDLSRPDLKAVRAAVAARDWEAAKRAWAEHLRRRKSPRWTWTLADRDRIIALYDRRFGGLKRYVPGADKVLAREFDFLGVHKKLGHNIQWLQGPWEWTHVLSRFGYWKGLGYAYWATGDSKYAADFVYMLEDWIADNPVPRILTNSRGKHGTVWRTLETGIRAELWFDVMQLFMDAPEFDAQAKYLMTRSLVEHARHLYRYEVGFRYGNWQVVECTGLAAVGIMLPEFKEAAAWRQRAFHYLVEHMHRDVYPDGAHHELTPGYHSWVMERFLKAALLAKINGYEVPGLLDRHEKMFEFLMKISKPNHRYPPLGDAGGPAGGNIEGWMGVGALLYHRPDMRYLAVDHVLADWVWLFGPEVVERYAALKQQRPDFESCLLPYAKYCMMRTGWDKQDRYLLFDCAPWGSGHSHQDRLQVIVYAGRDLLVDSGQFSYDQPLSAQYFRRTAAHNVVMIDGQEQPDSDPNLLSWFTSDLVDFASGEIHAAGLRHQRSVVFLRPDYWVVVDHVFGQGAHQVKRLFHFPGSQVRFDPASSAAWTTFARGTNIWLKAADSARLTEEEGWLPTGSATAEKAPVAAFVADSSLPAVFVTVLVPFSAREHLPQIERFDAGGPLAVGLRIRFPDGQTDEIAIADEVRKLRIDSTQRKARALVVRRGPEAKGMAVVDEEAGQVREQR